jgi:hypothetical protein
MIIFETHFNDLKLETAPLQPKHLTVSTDMGPMAYYPRLISGDRLTTKAFKLLETGYYEIYMECLQNAAGGRFQCKTADDVVISTKSTYEEFDVPTLYYLGTIYNTASKKERLKFEIVSSEASSDGEVIIGGRIFVEFLENAFR